MRKAFSPLLSVTAIALAGTSLGQICPAQAQQSKAAPSFLSDAEGVSLSSLDRPTRLSLSTSQRVRLARASTSLLESSTRLQLSVFSNWKGTAVRTRLEKRSDGILWAGKIEGDRLSNVLFMVRNGHLIGRLSTDGGDFMVQSVGKPASSSGGPSTRSGGDLVTVSQPEKVSGDWCGELRPPASLVKPQAAPIAGRGLASTRAEATEETTIDIMFVYSPEALATDPNIEASIAFTVADANQKFANSGLATKLRLVHTARVNYTDGKDLGEDLGRVAGTQDGYMDEVHKMRDDYGADMVCFVRHNSVGGVAGLAYVMGRNMDNQGFQSGAFSVVAVDQLVWATAHELGHNMGSTHDNLGGGGAVYEYSAGYSNPDAGFHTIMSYGPGCSNTKPCRRVDWFSNPDLTENGAPTGVPEGKTNPADNYKTFTRTTPIVAAFRSARSSIVVSNTSVSEGNAGERNVLFSVSRLGAIAKPLTVKYAFSDVTATKGVDYKGTDGTLQFAAGEATKTIAFSIIGDTVYEGDETFNIDFTAEPGQVLKDVRATITIVEDDNPTLTLTGGEIVEGDGSGLPQLEFKVKTAPVQLRNAQVSYATRDITAPGVASTQAGIDYYPTQGTLELAPNQTEATIRVPIRGDNIAEPDETFELVLSNPVNLTLAQTSAVGKIINDDVPSIDIAPVLTREGSEEKDAKFNVTLSMAWPTDISVAYTTIDGTATAGSDYEARSGRITFAAGQTSQVISVPIIDDQAVEPDEVFSVRLSDARGGRIANGDAVCRIQDNDSPGVSVFDAQEVEGSGSDQRFLRFEVVLDAAMMSPVTVAYGTRDGSATAGQDYDATSGTLTFAAGQVRSQVLVPIRGDLLVEGAETLQLVLSAPNGVRLAREAATGTIIDDDIPSLSIGNASARESRGGSFANFTVTLSDKWATPITVAYATVAGTASTTDYVQQSGRLVFEPGQTSKVISVRIVDDAIFEPNELFTVRLSDPQGARIQSAVGTGTIVSDDAQPVISGSSVRIAEGNAGLKQLAFPVRLSNPSSQRITVVYRTVSGTALAGSDFRAVAGTLVFNPGVTAATINVPIVGDTLIERDEAFLVQLFQPVNARVSTPALTGTILNDDRDSVAPVVTILSPRASSASSAWPTFNGTATDATGLTRLTVKLQRTSDGRFWNGGGWALASDPRTAFNAARVGTATSARWSLALAPAAGHTLSGRYRVIAEGYDAANNRGQALTVFDIDRSGPAVAITSPRDRSAVRAMSAITGTAVDVPGGVAKVEVSVQRASDRLYWNGRTWAAAATFVRATLSGNAWRVVGLPAQWNPGAYVITARATDKMGNASSKAASVTVASNARS